MIEIRINLPDQLAQEASHAGLLTPEIIERMLRAHLKKVSALMSSLVLLTRWQCVRYLLRFRQTRRLIKFAKCAHHVGNKKLIDAHSAGYQCVGSGHAMGRGACCAVGDRMRQATKFVHQHSIIS